MRIHIFIDKQLYIGDSYIKFLLEKFYTSLGMAITVFRKNNNVVDLTIIYTVMVEQDFTIY